MRENVKNSNKKISGPKCKHFMNKYARKNLKYTNSTKRVKEFFTNFTICLNKRKNRWEITKKNTLSSPNTQKLLSFIIRTWIREKMNFQSQGVFKTQVFKALILTGYNNQRIPLLSLRKWFLKWREVQILKSKMSTIWN